MVTHINYQFLNFLGLSKLSSPTLFLFKVSVSGFMLNFFLFWSPIDLFSKCFNLFSTFALRSTPILQLLSSSFLEKASTLTASEALAASVLLTLPLTFAEAWPTRLAWNRIPYLGVSFFCLSAWNSAFSAPRICRVLAGYLARLIRLPAAATSLAPTKSPTKTVSLGASIIILFCK